MALSERNFAEALSNSQKSLTISASQLKRLEVTATFTSGLAETMSGSGSGRLKCDQSVNSARAIGDPLLLAESLLTLAEAQLQKPDAAAALKSALEAQQLAARIGSPEAELTAWLIAARASRAVGDFSNAHDYATRADKLLRSFEQMWGSADYNSFLNRPDIQLSHTQLNDSSLRSKPQQPQGAQPWETKDTDIIIKSGSVEIDFDEALYKKRMAIQDP